MTATRIDGHAHFYPQFSLSTYLNAARKNFQGADGILLLAQPDDTPPLDLLEQRLPEVQGEWTYDQPDSTSYVFRQQSATIVMIAGRQLVTYENLELLTLCSSSLFSPRLPLRDLLNEVAESDAVPVVPWGFGKWWFSRGKIVRDLIRSTPQGYLLGDSGCRPTWYRSPILVTAMRQGIGVLAGTDPLPIRSHETRVGSYYTVLSEPVDLRSPTRWVRQQLTGSTKYLNRGVRRNPTQFLSDQLRIRLAANQ